MVREDDEGEVPTPGSAPQTSAWVPGRLDGPGHGKGGLPSSDRSRPPPTRVTGVSWELPRPVPSRWTDRGPWGWEDPRYHDLLLLSGRRLFGTGTWVSSLPSRAKSATDGRREPRLRGQGLSEWTDVPPSSGRHAPTNRDVSSRGPAVGGA